MGTLTMGEETITIEDMVNHPPHYNQHGVECKSRAKFAVYDIISQAESHVTKGTKPLVIIKANRKEPLAVVYAKDFLEMSCQKVK